MSLSAKIGIILCAAIVACMALRWEYINAMYHGAMHAITGDRMWVTSLASKYSVLTDLGPETVALRDRWGAQMGWVEQVCGAAERPHTAAISSVVARYGRGLFVGDVVDIRDREGVFKEPLYEIILRMDGRIFDPDCLRGDPLYGVFWIESGKIGTIWQKYGGWRDKSGVTTRIALVARGLGATSKAYVTKGGKRVVSRFIHGEVLEAVVE